MENEMPDKRILKKLEGLKAYLREAEAVAVAFSGGVDSAFLMKVAHDVLGEKAVAVSILAPFFSERETGEAENFCEREGIVRFCVPIMEDEMEGFVQNPPERCYICKKAMFERIINVAKEQEISWVADGSNVDDEGDYRPGLRALQELGVKSPLRDMGLKKEDIRILCKYLGLSVWQKPSAACLASRFAYGEEITVGKLRMVEQAEEFLRGMGFTQLRVRVHGMIARLEVPVREFSILLEGDNREKIADYLYSLGFQYVTLDMQGYRMGSMNEELKLRERNVTIHSCSSPHAIDPLPEGIGRR